MCEYMRKYFFVLLFLFFKAITKDRTPIGVDLGVLVLGLVGPTPGSTTAGLAAAYGPFLPAVYHPFVLREAG